MMKIRISKIALVGLVLALFWACNDQGELGDEIIDSNNFEVFIDSFSFQARTLSTDSVFSGGLSDYYLLGRTNDDVFGTFDAAFYIQLSMRDLDQTFPDVTIDSVFMELQYDTFTYGDLESEFSIYVHRLTELPDAQVQISSNEELDFDDTPLGAIENFVVSNYVETSDTTQELDVLRIPLDMSLGEELLGYDSIVYTNNPDFYDLFNGIYITGNSNNQGMTSFNLLTVDTRLVVYYTDSVGDPREFDLGISGSDFRLPVFSKDQSGSEVENFLNDFELGKEHLFISGLAGNYVEVDLAEAASQLDGKIVNSAQLCFPFDEMAFGYDYQLYPELDILALRYENENGNLFRILDEGGFFYDSSLRFDGDTVSTDREFCILITSQFQDIVKGEAPDRISLFPVLRVNSPEKIILNSFEAEDRPAHLQVIYSQPIN